MTDCSRRLPDNLQNCTFVSHIGARAELGATINDSIYSRLGEYLTRAFEAGDGHFYVAGIGEPVWRDDGVGEGGGGIYGHVAPRKRSDEADERGYVVAPVSGKGDKIIVEGHELNVGPVGTEGRV